MVDDITSLSSVSCVAYKSMRCVFAKKDCRCSNVYLTININAFLKIKTEVYFFKPAYLAKRNPG